MQSGGCWAVFCVDAQRAFPFGRPHLLEGRLGLHSEGDLIAVLHIAGAAAVSGAPQLGMQQRLCLCAGTSFRRPRSSLLCAWRRPLHPSQSSALAHWQMPPRRQSKECQMRSDRRGSLAWAWTLIVMGAPSSTLRLSFSAIGARQELAQDGNLAVGVCEVFSDADWDVGNGSGPSGAAGPLQTQKMLVLRGLLRRWVCMHRAEPWGSATLHNYISTKEQHSKHL